MKVRWIRSCWLKAGGGWKPTAYTGPFHSHPVWQITSLPAFETCSEKKDTSFTTSDCNIYVKATNVYGVHARIAHKHAGLAADVHPLNINCFSGEVQILRKLQRKYLQAAFNIFILYNPPTKMLPVCMHAQAHLHRHTYTYTRFRKLISHHTEST